MAERNPLVLTDLGGGVGKIEELPDGDTLPAAATVATLTDAAASSALPPTGAVTTLAALLQAVRNPLKWLVTRFNGAGQLSPSYGGNGTSTGISAAAQSALDAKANLNRVPVMDVLRCLDISSQNLNSIVSLGFYKGNNLVNAPAAGHWYLQVMPNNNAESDFIMQLLWPLTDTPSWAGPGTMFIRTCQAGAGWGSWETVITTKILGGMNFPIGLTGDTAMTLGPNTGWGKSIRVGGNPLFIPPDTASHGVTNGNVHSDCADGDFIYFINFFAGTGGLLVGGGNGSSVFGTWDVNGVDIRSGGIRMGPLAPRTAVKRVSGTLGAVGADTAVASLGGVPLANVCGWVAVCTPLVSGNIRIPPGFSQAPAYGPEKQFLYSVYPSDDGNLHAQVHPDGSGVAGSPVEILLTYLV